MQELDSNFAKSPRPVLPPPVAEAMAAMDPHVLRVLHVLGWSVVRADRGFVWTERGSVLGVSSHDLDPDDTLLQIAFHECMHWLVEGPAARWRDDWGLCNAGDADLAREHAALVLQARIADTWDLREPLAPTTDHWRFYADLPERRALQRLLDHHEAVDPLPLAALTAARTGYARWRSWGHRPVWERILRHLQGTLRARTRVPQGSTAAD